MINGVLLPGTVSVFCDIYKEKARFIYKKALEMNDKGVFFPLWGTCQGYKYFLMFASDEGDKIMDTLTSHNVSLPLKFQVDPTQTKMFKDAGAQAFAF